MSNGAEPATAVDADTGPALGAEFDTPDRQDWERLVDRVLERTGRGRDSLVTTTDDGIHLHPLYTADDTDDGTGPPTGVPGLPPFVRGARPDGAVLAGWDVRARHDGRDPGAVNEAVLADLDGGVTSLWLRLGEDGLPVSALGEALREVRLDLAPVVLDAGADYEAAGRALLAAHRAQGVPDTEVAGNLGADPIGLRARAGGDGKTGDVAAAAALTAELARRHPRLATLVADGLPYHGAGGSDAQEIGAAVATAVAYLRALADAGLDVADAAARIEFRLAATTDQFGTIAKFRAARRVWARVTEASGAPEAAMRQHAVTSPAMLTRRDPEVNLLRTTVACFAAGTGGADAVTVLPFDSALGDLGQPDRFSRRLARNTQAILLEESRLAAVIDPAGGSWYVEARTDALAHAAWDEFTAIERAGGIEAELESGALAGRLAHTRRARAHRIATRQDVITGVSEYPNLAEPPSSRPHPPEQATAGGLPTVRYAEDFERLRDRSDAHLARHGSRPAVFLATLGPLAQHTARTGFATNLFQAGGIEPVEPVEPGGAGGAGGARGAEATTAELVDAFTASGTTVACLCGSDTAYAESADEVASALRDAGATSVLLAGRPGTAGSSDSTAVTGHVYTGCDALAVLTGILDTLGVAP